MAALKSDVWPCSFKLGVAKKKSTAFSDPLNDDDWTGFDSTLCGGADDFLIPLSGAVAILSSNPFPLKGCSLVYDIACEWVNRLLLCILCEIYFITSLLYAVWVWVQLHFLIDSERQRHRSDDEGAVQKEWEQNADPHNSAVKCRMKYWTSKLLLNVERDAGQKKMFWWIHKGGKVTKVRVKLPTSLQIVYMKSNFSTATLDLLSM